MEKIKTKYQELSKKHKLPPFDKLNNEFEISSIEETEFLLREIRRKITEKIENYKKVLDGVLQPDTSYTDMYEASALTSEEIDNAFKLLKKLMNLDRYSIETSIGETDEKTARFLKLIYEDWPEINKSFLIIINKLKLSWLKEIKVKKDTGYLG